MTKRANLVGKRFERLTVIRLGYCGPNYQWHWDCRCDCGAELAVSAASLKSGNTKSCGCLKVEKAAAHMKALRKSQLDEWQPPKIII